MHNCASTEQQTISFRQFSNSPNLGKTGSTTPTDPDYNALQFFINYAQQYTSALNDSSGNQTVLFQTEDKWPTSPACTVIEQVGGTKPSECANRTAAYDSGGALNSVWGFIPRSGRSFGMTFNMFRSFLQGAMSADEPETGLQMFQRILDSKSMNVKVLPVLGR